MKPPNAPSELGQEGQIEVPSFIEMPIERPDHPPEALVSPEDLKDIFVEEAPRSSLGGGDTLPLVTKPRGKTGPKIRAPADSDNPEVVKAWERLHKGPRAALKAGRHRVEITQQAMEDHPGGAEAAMIEASMPIGERAQFRLDVISLLGQGLSQGYAVASIAYQQALARRFRMEIEAERQAHPEEALAALGSMRNLADTEKQIKELIAAEDKRRQTRASITDDPATLLEQEQVLAEEWIRANIGEHIGTCPNCNQPLTLPELPHWAHVKVEGRDGPEYPVWSSEMWKMVTARKLPLWQMAYFLRTSIEALHQVALLRGDEWPEEFVGTHLELEERYLRKEIMADDNEYKQKFLIQTPNGTGSPSS